MSDAKEAAAPSSLAARLALPLREFGACAGLLYLANRLLRALSPRVGIHLHDFMAQPIPEKPVLSAGMSRNLAFREIQAGDPEIERMPVPASVIAARYQAGAVCLGTFSKNELVGYLWLRFGAFEEDVVRTRYLLPEQGEAAFDFDLFVLPQRRLGTGFAAIWHGANLLLRERGVRCTFSRVSRYNLASRRAHARLGARRIGSAVYLQVQNFEMMFSTLAPFFRVSMGRKSTPQLRLHAPPDSDA